MSASEKAKAKAEQVKGAIKKETGRAADNDQAAAEGQGDKTKGSLREAKEKAKDAFKK
ncbi:CsbD family protein [Streptomyces sp. NPDC017529]|uniref:CsbD family protein n=1 Tax=Streptomyces sp. NPDC017529 TaxID=3365000 RepID=UPI0037A91DF7